MNVEIQNDLKTLASELKQLRTDVDKIGVTIKNTAYSGGATAAEHVQKSGERLFENFKSNGAKIVKKIEDQPITAALTAFGIGVIIGKLFTSRRS